MYILLALLTTTLAYYKNLYPLIEVGTFPITEELWIALQISIVAIPTSFG